MISSNTMPAPLGIAETNPSAEAPSAIASRASATLAMQQILTRGRAVASMGGLVTRLDRHLDHGVPVAERAEHVGQGFEGRVLLNQGAGRHAPFGDETERGPNSRRRVMKR